MIEAGDGDNKPKANSFDNSDSNIGARDGLGDLLEKVVNG
jgi:hypothetical protein